MMDEVQAQLKEMEAPKLSFSSKKALGEIITDAELAARSGAVIGGLIELVRQREKYEDLYQHYREKGSKYRDEWQQYSLMVENLIRAEQAFEKRFGVRIEGR